MKNILICIIVGLLVYIFMNVEYPYEQKYGVVKTIDVHERYDPVTHTNKPIYSIGVEFDDTIKHINVNNKLNVGDTIIIKVL